MLPEKLPTSRWQALPTSRGGSRPTTSADGVDKRIDVLATAIHAGLKATQLKDLDLAYAPPYSSAKDPVNMAGFMIDNISKGLKQWHLQDVAQLPRDGSVTLLDTRTVGEYSRGHIEGFVNIPVDELRERIDISYLLPLMSILNSARPVNWFHSCQARSTQQVWEATG